MHVPVKDGRGQLSMLDLYEEVIYLQADREGGLILHTEHGAFTLVRRVGDWSSLLEKIDYVRVDRGTIVNMRKDWRFDRELRVLRLRGERMIQIPVAENMGARLFQRSLM